MKAVSSMSSSGLLPNDTIAAAAAAAARISCDGGLWDLLINLQVFVCVLLHKK